MASKKVVKVENEIEDPKSVYLDLFDKNKDLKSLADDIQNISNHKDFEILKADKENYKNAESLYKERRELLKEIPNFWSAIFTDLFVQLGAFENLTTFVEDFFVIETDNSFSLQIDFKENNIIKNKQVTITVETPSKPEDMLSQDSKVTSTPIQLCNKSTENNKHPEIGENFENEELDSIQGFLKFLKEPTKEVCTFIVGSVWMDPISFFQGGSEEAEDDDEEDEE